MRLEQINLLRIEKLETRACVLENALCLVLEALQGGKVPGPEAFRAYIESECGGKNVKQ